MTPGDNKGGNVEDSREGGSRELHTRVDSRKVNSRQLESRTAISRKEDSREVDGRALGSRELDGRECGSRELDGRELGSRELDDRSRVLGTEPGQHYGVISRIGVTGGKAVGSSTMTRVFSREARVNPNSNNTKK